MSLSLSGSILSRFAKDRLQLLEVSLRRDQDPARAHDRFGDESAYRVRTLALDQALDLGDQPVGELLLRPTSVAEALEMRARDVDHVAHRPSPGLPRVHI